MASEARKRGRCDITMPHLPQKPPPNAESALAKNRSAQHATAKNFT